MARPQLTASIERWSTRIILAAVVVLLTIIITQDVILKLGLLQRLELASIDYRFAARGIHPSIKDSSDIVIIEISDESFKTLPAKWPWPRSYYAHLIRNLKEAGARAVGIDIILSGNDVYSPENDEALRQAIRETGIVILAGKLDVLHDQYIRLSADENYGNIFFNVDSSIGLVNIWNDADGVYRRYAPFFTTAQYDRESETALRIPTFGFAVLNKYFGLPPLTAPRPTADGFELGETVIPRYDPVSLLINFYGPSGTFKHVKFADVIDDETLTTTEEALSGEEINTFSDPEYGYKYDGTFKDKIVLVGSTMPEDHDLFPVAVARGEKAGDNLMYGVELHANVIESILRKEFLYKQSKLSELLLIFLLTGVTFYASSVIKGTKSRQHFLIELGGVAFAVGEIALIVVAAIVLFNHFSFILTVTSPIVAVIGSYIANITYHFVVERKQRVLIKNMFSTYVNPSVVEELISHPEKLTLGGQRKELTVMFSDIEGFTTISEGMPPEQLVSLLNEYLSAMAEVILRNRGTLDKYEGDAVMAFWGAPIPQDDHALRACISALEMQNALTRVRDSWVAQSRPGINMRIGINTGEMIVGNMGGVGKFDYTVIGDSVNIASRLEGVNKVYRTNVLVSETTYDQVKHRILGREMGLIAVKGRSEPLRTYEILQMMDGSVSPELKEFLERYSAGLKLYRTRKWADAIAKFQEALALRADDHATKVFIERATYFISNPPPADWNGVFEMTSK